MDNRIGMPSRVAQVVRDLGSDYYLRSEVARALDVAPTTLKAWGQEDPALAPHGYVLVGRTMAWVYTPEDLVALQAHMEKRYPIRANGLRTRRRGTPRLWTNEEREDRGRRQRRAAYLARQAERALENGDEEGAASLAARAQVLREHLTRERAVRWAEATAPRRQTADWLMEITHP